MTPEHRSWGKTPRLSNMRMVITEKIDGTNALVHVAEDGTVRAGSRKRWITTVDDNHGFAAWVEEHADDLRGLGPGYHYGEWWGRGIQRGYGLMERRFSLFLAPDMWALPDCVSIVPTLYVGSFDELEIHEAYKTLRDGGSRAVPGYPHPEGIVVWFDRTRYKVLLDGRRDADGITWAAKPVAA